MEYYKIRMWKGTEYFKTKSKNALLKAINQHMMVKPLRWLYGDKGYNTETLERITEEQAYKDAPLFGKTRKMGRRVNVRSLGVIEDPTQSIEERVKFITYPHCTLVSVRQGV